MTLNRKKIYLLIDNVSTVDRAIYYFYKDQWNKESLVAGVEDVLSMLEKIILKLKIQWTEVEAIGVVVGLGSFTSTRVAVTVANVLHLAFGLSVFGLSVPDFGLFEKEYEKNPAGYLSATYSGLANVGKNKKKINL